MKKFIIFIAAFLTMIPVFAQSEDEVDDNFFNQFKKEKSNAFFIGPKIGGTLTTMSQPDEGDLYDSGNMGFSGGLAMKFRFGKATENSDGGTGLFAAGLELKYKRNSVKTLGTDETGKENASLSLDYFEVPVFVHIYPFVKSSAMNSFYVELGVSFAGTLSRSPETLTITNTKGNYSKVVYNIDTENSSLKGTDVRPFAGLGYTIPGTGLDINARYYVGTSDLAGNFPCKMNSLEISLAWMIRAARF